MKSLILAAISACALCIGCTSSPKSIGVIPIPQHVAITNGNFHLGQQTGLNIEAPEADKTALQNFIEASPIAHIAKTSKPSNSVNLFIVDCLPEITSPEGYRMTVNEATINIEATAGAGLFYGLQTLLQLIDDSDNIPQGVISDEPRFDYRGMMIDVSRHFFSVDFIKKQIDAMAYFKFNHLHLHLTDAAGWRIEIKKYPELTRQAAWRTHPTWKEWWNAERHYSIEGSPDAHGGYYTQEQIRDLVAYAQERFITIIPEIEMPSHSEEVLAVYPELSCSGSPYKDCDFCIGNEQTFTFLQNVLTEVMQLFPSKYIHIGGDEASKQAWATCPKCLSRMKNEKLANVDELQSYLIHRIEGFLNANGRNLIGWDEILDGGLAPNATVMSWRGAEGGIQAIEAGHRAIMTPGEFCYLDAYQDAPHTQPEAIGGYLPLKKVYSYDPLPDSISPEQAHLLYGVQGNLFAEYIPTEQHMEYMMYPRMLAIAEIAWSNPEVMNYDDFRARAVVATNRLNQWGYNSFNLLNEVGNRPGSETSIEHLASGKKVTYATNAPYSAKYTAGGDSALVDGKLGGWTYGDKRWQGFSNSTGIDATIDLETLTELHSINADFMQICGPWVFMPTQVIISASTDGKNFTELTRIDHEIIRDDAVSFKTFGWEGLAQARYVRYQAIPGELGGFLFLDEIIIK
ncbi:MAG: beta-N-acetylhexosaminidase [Bacteroidales bacterium]|nr:beta-N-acetylhexosaminidase [Bacteroidales bacterium]